MRVRGPWGPCLQRRSVLCLLVYLTLSRKVYGSGYCAAARGHVSSCSDLKLHTETESQQLVLERVPWICTRVSMR